MDQTKTILQTNNRAECFEARLVLESIGVPADVFGDHREWRLVVGEADYQRATQELDSYNAEKRSSKQERKTEAIELPAAVRGVICYSAVIILVAVCASHGLHDLPWMSQGRMLSGDVMSGQWWRVVTALTLHLDFGHLLSNLAFGAVFGFLAGRVLGGGMAWLAIVIAGGLGNLLNAMVQLPTHASIGASTAVFAALGIVVAHALKPAIWAREEKLLKRWSPLIAGVVLLAMTGVGGERTDVTAHVTGFLAGLATGWIGSRLPIRWLVNPRVQTLAGIQAIVLVAIAWVWAFLPQS